MNKKGNEMNFPVKILLGLVLLLTFLAGADAISVGLTKTSLIGMIISSPNILFVIYVIVGICVLISAGLLSFKIFKR